jgi:hypothetical protein
MKILFALFLLSSTAAAATLDAAELDIHGNPLIYDGTPFVAWRCTVDNREGVTDLVDVRFKMNWTGDAVPISDMWWDNPANPWYGAPNVDLDFFIDGVWWHSGVVWWIATQEISPVFTPEGALPDPSTWGVVPVGCSWDAIKGMKGEDVALFQSPASGDLSIDGVVTTLYDYDPLPQTIPEPATLLLLSAGGLAALRRRQFRNQ